MQELDKSIKTIAKGSGIIFIGIILSKILTYIYRVIVARIGVEEYGLFSIGLAVISFLAIITSLGLGEGVVRYVSYYIGKNEETKARSVIKSSLLITGTASFIIATFLIIFSGWISTNIFHDSSLTIILAVFAIALPLDVIKKIILSAIRAFQKIEYDLYSRNIIENIAKILLTLLLIYLGFGILGVVIGYVAAFAISLVVSIYFLRTKVFSLEGTTTKIRYKDLMYYSLPLLFAGVMLFVMGWIDTLMISYFKTSVDVGLYNAALPLAQLLYLFPYALSFLFLPTLSTLYAQNKKEIVKPLYHTLTKWIFLVNLALLAGIVLFSKQIINTIFGKEYLTQTIIMGKEILPVPLSLIILSLGLFFGYFMMLGSNFFLVAKQTKIILFNTSVIAVLNLILNMVLIPAYGILGAAISTSFSFFIMGLLLLVEIRAKLKIWPFNIKYLRVLVAVIISFVLTYFISRLIHFNKDAYSLFVNGAIFIIIYLIALLITKSFERADIMILKTIETKTGITLRPLKKILRKFI